MANTTISALPSATTPLSGTEVVPIVQSGVTKKVAASYIGNVAAGSNTQIQYNSSNVLAGSANLTFDGTNLVTAGSATGAAFIPSGSTVPTNGMYLPTTNTIAWSTNTTERIRLNSSGNLLLGTTSNVVSYARAQIVNNDVPLVLRQSTSTAGKYWNIGPFNSASTLIVYNQDNTGVYIADGATSWTANSDERLKTAITPFKNAAQKICSLRSGTGRYLTDNESVSRSFLIAQDVQTVLPEAVDVQDNEQKTLGLRYTDIIPLLTAAIQEQQAVIQSLTDRIAQLEAK